jgi:hypothetical protein
MEIHKPKAIHGWRDLIKEIGTIVIGVSIALGAEQAVEYFHWKSQVAQAKEVIATELASSVVSATARVGSHGCVERRLADLSQILDTASAHGSLPPVGTGAWDNVVASQAATHFPRQYLTDLAGIYRLVQSMGSRSVLEIEDWSDIGAMIGPGRRLDPASEADLRKALIRASGYDNGITSLAGQLLDGVTALHLPFSQKDLENIAAMRRRALDDKAATTFSICRPLGAVPSHYGLSPVGSTSRDVLVKSIADFGKLP